MVSTKKTAPAKSIKASTKKLPKKAALNVAKTAITAPVKTAKAQSQRAHNATALTAGLEKKVPSTGPLTLAEAKALTAAKRPKAMARPVAALMEPVLATPRSVAAERESLRKAQDAEIVRRVREYEATMTILKQRGVRSSLRAPVPAVAGRAPRSPATAPAGFVPLQILAEGDSWFDYPPFAIKGGLVPRLERRLGVPILNLAKAGDEVRFMLGVEQYKLLAEHLQNGCPAGGAWDVLLFSGGGNDIVDNPMALWIKDWDATQPPESHLHTLRFAAALSLVRAGYEDLIAMRDRLSPTTSLVFHGYDFAIPDGRGVCFNALGPWMKPAFDLRGFPSQEARAAVVRVMLATFAMEIQALAGAHPHVTFVNGQGLLPNLASWWHNELHPSSGGYDVHAGNFYASLKQLFPTRVA
ncbi:hypothetical protein [Aquabacterium sp. CECT 9606]|uniref:hypothetical protein n=1 Tax=Aquabacterium sp. CECT 9606 TaxID=2845822 RepID=UPI001E5CE69A|nr:hypothetical protein [Aquabacterium sp. CECT 9606]CAH0353153.1 hypothetical protein AQB9606_03088 [Aquabacterium sp. CECT 9606]